MGIAKLYGKSNSGGTKIDGIIANYYAYAGENISAGDFVEFVNGIASTTNYGTSTTTTLDTSHTPATVNQTSARAIDAVLLTSGNVLLIVGVSNNLYGWVISVSGKTITVGTKTKIATLSSTTPSSYKLCALDNGNAFVVYASDTDSSYSASPYGVVLTISNRTITVGTSSQIVQVSSGGCYPALVKLVNNRVLFYYSSSNQRTLYGVILRINGTSFTIGTSTTITTGYYLYSRCAVAIEPEKNVLAYRNGGSSNNKYIYYYLITTNGMVVNAPSTSSVNSGGSSYADYLGVAMGKLTSDKVFCTFNATSSRYLYAYVLSIAKDGTLTPGSNLVVEKTSNTTTNHLAVINENVVFVPFNPSYSGSYCQNYACVCVINGTTATLYSRTQINTSTGGSAGQGTGILLPNKTILSVSTFMEDSSATVSSAHDALLQVFNVTSNNTISTNITVTEYETQVRKVTSQIINGVAKVAGTGGSTTAHNEQVTIKMPDIVPKEWEVIEDGTKYVAKDGTILTSSGYLASNNCPPILAFDGDDSTYWFSNSSDAIGKNVWLQLEFPFAHKIKTIRSKLSNHQAISQIDILGSNDGSVWTTLHTFTASQAQFYTTTLTTNGFFKYYKIDYTMSSTGYVKVYGFEVLE